MNLEKTIEERHESYGYFCDNGTFAQRIKAALREGPNWDNLEPYQAEALEVIATKISRILTGSYRHVDSWRDIGGYAELVAQNLEGTKR